MKNVGSLQPQKAVPNFEHAMKKFLKWSETEHSAHPATYVRYKTSSKALLKRFGKTALDNITPESVQKYKEWRSTQKTTRRGVVQKQLGKPATVNGELACLKKLFNYFSGEYRQLRNPVSEVKFLDEGALHERVVTFDEEQRYLAACTQPLKDVAVLMLETGMRPEEVYRMLVKNVNGRTYFNPYGKTKAARRRIPLTNKAFEIVTIRSQTAKNGFLFPVAGRLYETDYKAKQRSLRRHPARKGGALPYLRSTPHLGNACGRVRNGPVTLVALLGHSKIEMVRRYTHPSEQHHLAASQCLEAFQQERRNASKAKAEANEASAEH